MRSLAVIVPFYNQARYFDALVSSVRGNTCNPHIYIVNDGSKPDEIEKIRHICESSPDITLLNKKNGGVASARNFGLLHSTEPYLLFLDGDDVVGTGQLDLQLNAIKSGDQDVCITKWARLSYHLGSIVPQNPYNGEHLDALFLAKHWGSLLSIPIHTVMLKRAAVEITFEETLRSNEDLLFWMNFFRTPKKMSFVDKYCAGYRVGGFSAHKKVEEIKQTFIKVIEKCKEGGFDEDVLRELRINFRRMYGTWS